MKSRSWMAGVGVCLAMGMAGAAVGAEYYINDDTYVPGDDVYTFAKGHDGNPGTAASPKATLGNVIGTCNLQPGDVVYIDTGTYAPVVISNTVVGAAGAPIVITGVPITNWNSGGTVFSGSGYPLDVRGRHITIQNVKAKDGSWGIALTGADHNLFERVLASGSGHGVRNAGSINSNRFVRSVFLSAFASAINIQNGSGNSFEYCLASNPNSVSVIGTPASVSEMSGCLIGGTRAISTAALTPAAGRYNLFFPSSSVHDEYDTVEALQRANTNWVCNTVADPRFANGNTLDFHLLSASGYLSNGVWVTNAAVGYSPAIDFGARGASVGDEPDPNGGRVNIGLYGGTAEASKSRTDPWLFAMSFNDGGNLIQTGRNN